jgi:uncharacterized protein
MNITSLQLESTLDLQIESQVALRLVSLAKTDNIENFKTNLKNFCDRWLVEEFYLFGSVLREDFRADSDVDVLIKFNLNSRIGLIELVGMKQELEDFFGRDVDLLTKGSIEQSHNWIRQKEIFGTMRLIYVSR